MRMTRVSACATFAAIVVGVTVAGGQQQPVPVFRGASDAVRLFVTVTDNDGRLVTTLTQDDFQVRDEGKPQPITIFDNTPQPIRLIVMLDVSGSMVGNLPLLRAGTDALVRRLRPDDVVRIGTFGHEIDITEKFTRDANELRQSLPDSISENAPTPLWRAIDEAIEGFDEGDRSVRPVVLVLSDGKDSGVFGIQDRYVSQSEVIDRARAENVMVYGIGMRSRARTVQPGFGPQGAMAALTADLPDPGLAKVAEESGGGYAEIRLGQDLGAAFAQVADELHSQYLLGFAPPNRDGKVHDIEVRVTTQRGMKPRARKDYVAPKDGAK